MDRWVGGCVRECHVGAWRRWLGGAFERCIESGAGQGNTAVDSVHPTLQTRVCPCCRQEQLPGCICMFSLQAEATQSLSPCPTSPTRRQERFQGYICENSLKLKSVSRNSTQLGDTVSSALDAAISAGGNYLTVCGRAIGAERRAGSGLPFGAAQCAESPQRTRLCLPTAAR